MSLAGAAYDMETRQLRLPRLSEDCEYLFELDSRKTTITALTQLLSSWTDKIADSSDFLERATDLPDVDPLVAAHILNSNYAATPAVSLETPTTAKSQLTPLMLAADDAVTIKSRVETADRRTAQELLDERDNNLVPVRTEIL